MELNQALKKLATHGQKWHSPLCAGRAACTLLLLLLRKTLIHFQWLRGHEEHLCIFRGKFRSGLHSREHRAKSQSWEDLEQVFPTLNETTRNEAHAAIWEMPDTEDGWNCSTDIFPRIEIAFVEIYFWGIRLYFILFFSFFFPPDGGSGGGGKSTNGWNFCFCKTGKLNFIFNTENTSSWNVIILRLI